MKKKAVFYHAGCPVCVNAEQSVLAALDKNRFDVEHIRAANPDIVYARGSAYGDKGDEREIGGEAIRNGELGAGQPARSAAQLGCSVRSGGIAFHPRHGADCGAICQFGQPFGLRGFVPACHKQFGGHQHR